MRIDDLSAPTRRFVARLSAFVGTGFDRLGRAPIWPAADATFTAVFAVPSGATPPELPPRVPTPPSDASVALPLTSRISTRTSPRTAGAAGAAQSALFMVLDHAGFSGRLLLGSTLRRAFRALSCLWPPPRAHLGSQHLSRLYQSRLTDDRAEPMSAPLLGLSTSSESPFDPTAVLNAPRYSELHVGGSVARYSHNDWERDRCAEPA